MGRLRLPEGEKKKCVNVLVPKKIINELGMRESQIIAEEALIKEYKKALKNKSE